MSGLRTLDSKTPYKNFIKKTLIKAQGSKSFDEMEFEVMIKPF